jgi:hypothetical protein
MSKRKAIRAVASPEAVTCDMGDGLVLLDIRANKYYSLNKVGAFVWDLIKSPKSLEEICSEVTKRYSVSATRCRGDVVALISSLESVGLVRLQDEISSAADLEEGLFTSMPSPRGNYARRFESV